MENVKDLDFSVETVEGETEKRDNSDVQSGCWGDTNANILKYLHKELPPNNISITIYGTSEQEYREFTGSGNNFYKVTAALECCRKINLISFFVRSRQKLLKNL